MSQMEHCQTGNRIMHLVSFYRTLNSKLPTFRVASRMPKRGLRHSLRDPDNILQKSLQYLIHGARQRWTYAILWDFNGMDDPMYMCWHEGYIEGEGTNFRTPTLPSMEEQEHRKKVFREISNMFGDFPNLEIGIDTEWFFLSSVIHNYEFGSRLPCQAFYTSTAFWVSGTHVLASLDCAHANEARRCGIQTLVNIPLERGVVELGSTALIFPKSEFDLLDRVGSLFRLKNNMSIKEILCSDTERSSLISWPTHAASASETSVGNYSMVRQSSPLSKRDNMQCNSNSDSDNRMIEAFTKILRRGRG